MLGIAVPVAYAAPAQVTDVHQSEAGETSVTIAWNAILGQSVRYYVELSDDKTNWSDDYGFETDQDIFIPGLVAGHTYYARVRASQDYGKTFGAWSEVTELVTIPKEVKDVVQKSATTNSAKFSWSASAGATGYRFCEWVNDQEYVVATTSKTSYTLKKLSNKTAFDRSIYVRPIRKSTTGYVAEKAASYSWSYDGVSSYDVKLVPKKMATPKITSYLSNIGVIYYDLTSVPFQKGVKVAFYKHNGKKAVKTTNDTWRADGLKRNVFYKVKAAAYTTVGTSTKAKYGAWSAYNYFCLGTETHTTSTRSKITARWNKVNGATNYTVYIAKDSNKGWKKVKTVKNNALKITKFGKAKLKSKSLYYVKVVANKKVGKKTYKSGGNEEVSIYTK